MVDAFLKEALMIIASYVGVLLLCFGALNWLMGGKLIPFLKVKASRGKLILVNVRTLTHDYYRAGRLESAYLIFKDSTKEDRRIDIQDEKSIYRASGVNNIVVDDENSVVLRRNLEGVSGHDGVKAQYLYTRALYKPSLTSRKDQVIIILLIVVLLIGIGCLFMLNKNVKSLELLVSLAQQGAGIGVQVIG